MKTKINIVIAFSLSLQNKGSSLLKESLQHLPPEVCGENTLPRVLDGPLFSARALFLRCSADLVLSGPS